MTTTYITVCKVTDLREGVLRLFSVAEHEVLLTLVRKAPYCVANLCSHMAKPLAQGRMIGYSLVCPFHSAQFDVRTGKSGGFPAARPIRTFPVRVQHGDVLIGIDLKHP